MLLVIILNGQVLEKREEKFSTLQSELDRVTALFDFAREHLNEQTSEAIKIKERQSELDAEVDRMLSSIREEGKNAQRPTTSADEDEKTLEAIDKKRAALEQLRATLEARNQSMLKLGDSVLGFSGDGERQYLTGLKLRSERTLILVDASASMLDETIVNIVRRKLMSPEERRSAPKWQRAVRTLHWLLANLQDNKLFQVYYFNTDARALVSGSERQWLDTNNAEHRKAAITAVERLAPDKGTNLHKALAVARRLSPAPDSIVLITDGLPTQGVRAVTSYKISGEDRLRLFEEATASVKGDIPISILLFPIEGDPSAAEAFWRLAILSNGSFITPSRDWP